MEQSVTDLHPFTTIPDPVSGLSRPHAITSSPYLHGSVEILVAT